VVTGAERQEPPKADPKGGRGGDRQPRHERSHRNPPQKTDSPQRAGELLASPPGRIWVWDVVRWLRSFLASPPA